MKGFLQHAEILGHKGKVIFVGFSIFIGQRFQVMQTERLGADFVLNHFRRFGMNILFENDIADVMLFGCLDELSQLVFAMVRCSEKARKRSAV